MYVNNHHAMKTYCGSAGIAPRILNLGITLRWLMSFARGVRIPRYPLDGWLGWPRRRCWCQREIVPVTAAKRSPVLQPGA